MGGDRDRDAKHLLSDGRDARQIIRTLEQVAEGTEAPLARPSMFERIVSALVPTVVPPAGVAVWNTSEVLLRGAADDDREAVLRAANERWGTLRRAPGTAVEPLEFWRKGLAAELRSGGGVAGFVRRAAEGVREWFTAAFGLQADTRDARTIAEQFIHRVEGLARVHPEETVEQHVSQAREDVLHSVPTHYRRRVLEHVLDFEEMELRQDGSATEAEQLQQARAARRARGWAAMTGGGGHGRG